MRNKEAKKKSGFLKIAQGLGIAIPASLLLATNVNAIPVNTISIETAESSINLQEENEVMKHIDQLTVSESNYLLASDDHVNLIHSEHSNHIVTHTEHSNHGASS